jgi:TonB family protein
MAYLSLAVEYAVRLAVLVGVVGLSLAVVRPALARTRLFVWVLVLGAAWVMPVMLVLGPEVAIPIPALSSAVDVGPAGIGGAILSPGTGTEVTPAEGRPLLARTLMVMAALYLAGLGVLLLRMASGWRLTRRLVSRATEVTDGELRECVSRRALAAGLRHTPDVRESALVRVPFAVGLWRPGVVLPHTWRSWDAPTRDAVVTHELAHIARGDLWTMRAANLYRALTWINPASWWLNRRLEALAETASDEAVLAAGIDQAAYAELLLGFIAASDGTSGRAAWHLAMARNGGADAERRIAQILDWKGGADMVLTFTKKVMIASGVVLIGVPAVVLTAQRVDIPTVVSAPVLTIDNSAGQQRSPTQGVITFDVAAGPAGAPASAVAVTMSSVPGIFTAVSIRNTGSRPIRRVTVQARVTSMVRPEGEPRVLRSVPLATWIAPGETVDVSSGLLDMKSASALATAGSIRATFSVAAVEFADGEVWPVAAPAETQVAAQSATEPYDETTPSIVLPVLMSQTSPKYTPEAMRYKIQGQVVLEAVVGADGTVKSARVVESLDSVYGLDLEAMKTAEQWKFKPGTLNGTAVPVVVRVTMEFRLH